MLSEGFLYSYLKRVRETIAVEVLACGRGLSTSEVFLVALKRARGR